MRIAQLLLVALLALAVAGGCSRRPKELDQPLPGGPQPAQRERGSGTATLSWSALAPEVYAEGAADPVTGFRIYLGRTAETLQLEAIVADPAATRHVVADLPSGRHFYAVTTYTRLGVESERSAVVSKDVP